MLALGQRKNIILWTMDSLLSVGVFYHALHQTIILYCFAGVGLMVMIQFDLEVENQQSVTTLTFAVQTNSHGAWRQP